MIELRPVVEADLPVFFEHQLDPEATAMADFPARDREGFFAHWGRTMRDNAALLRTVLHDGQVAGNVVSWTRDGVREVGYWIGKPFWGKGVATAALSAFLAVEATRPLYAHVARHNLGSVRVLEKCGFTRVGGDERELVLRLVAPAGGRGMLVG